MNKIMAVNPSISVMNINLMDLLPDYMHKSIGDLLELKKITNAIFHLNKIVHKEAEVDCLLKQCALILRKISTVVKSPQDRLSLYLRSNYAEQGCISTEYLDYISSLTEKELFITFSPMNITWENRERRKEFAMVAAAPNSNLTNTVNAYYSDKSKILQLLMDVVKYDQLFFHNIPICIVADILLLGGSADIYPKHFSLFMPEDEGKANARFKKTIIFANLLAHRFNYTTLQLGKYLIDKFNSKFNSALFGLLLIWMRGHDIGHSLRGPATSYKKLREINYFNSMALQELMADCVGYLLAFPSCGLGIYNNIDKDSAKDIFLAEMFRYLFKDNCHNPDSYAAFIELNYLFCNQYLDVYHNKIVASSDSFIQGISALLHAMVDCILQINIERTQSFLKQYGDYEHCNPKLKILINLFHQSDINFNFYEHIQINTSLEGGIINHVY